MAKQREQIQRKHLSLHDLTAASIKDQLNALLDKEHYATIDLSNNNLDTFEDVSKFKSLKTAILRNNKIKSIDRCEISSTLEKIDLTGNQLNYLPSLIHCKKLKHLFLGKNTIVELHGLPEGLKYINLEHNRIVRLRKDCFQNKSLYQIIFKSLSNSQIDELIQPPPEIFRQGYESIRQYFEEFSDDNNLIENLLKESKGKVIVIGESGAGKSSLCQSLLKGGGLLTTEDDHTVVVDILHWKANDDTRFQIFDQGGHEIYQVTNKLFLSGNCIVLVCHDATKCDEISVNKTLKIAIDAVRKYPKNKLYLVLTHADVVEDCTEIKWQFEQEIKTSIQREIEAIERNITDMDNKENTMLRHIQQEYKQQLNSIKCFIVSNLRWDGVDVLRDEIINERGSKLVKVPKRWVQCYQIIFQNHEKKFWTFADLLKEYAKLYRLSDLFTEAGIVESLKTYLKYLHDTGHILWFPGNPELEKIVFHNYDYVVVMFRALLHHDLESTVNYHKDTNLRLQFTPAEFSRAIFQFRTGGMLSEILMKTLWKSNGLSKDHFQFFIELLKATEAMFELETDEEISGQLSLPMKKQGWFDWFRKTNKIKHSSSTDNESYLLVTVKSKDKMYYVPWLVRNREEDRDTTSMFSPSMQSILQELVCHFPGTIPSCFFETMCVRLQKYAVNNFSPMQRRNAWSNGLFVNLDRIEIAVIRLSEKNEFKMKFRAPVEDLKKMWEHFEKLCEELKSLLKDFLGCANNLYVNCPHCLFHKHDNPSRLLLDDMFKFRIIKGNETFNCPNEKDALLPGVMIHPINQGSKRAITVVKEYLKEEWSDIPFAERLSVKQKEWMKENENIFKNLLHLSDVVHRLGVHLTSHQREDLLEMTPSQQACAFYNILLKGSQTMVQQLKFSLAECPCHANRILSNYIMTDKTQKPIITEDIMSQLLTKKEVNTILERKQTYISYMKVAEVIEKLLSHEVIDIQHHGELKTKHTQDLKIEYLLEDVLLRGTYETLRNFHSCLVVCGQEHLADLLPLRQIMTSNA